MADGGEWKCFHDINNESQRALAEMNETLGSLRQWQKQRKVDSLLLAHSSVEGATAAAPGEQLLLGTDPTTSRESRSDSIGMVMENYKRLSDESCNADGEDIHHNVDDEVVMDAEQEDPLLILWKEHHLRAQQAVGRLREQLERHPPVSSLRPRAATSTPENGGVEKQREEEKVVKASVFRAPPTGEGGELPAEPLPSNGGNEDNTDRVAKLGRDVDGLQVHQWIQTTRTQACGRAETLAREACEDVWRGAGSAAVGEMEGELDSFAKELDSLLLRIDRVDCDGGGDDRQEGARDGGILQAETPRTHHPEGELAPLADALVRCCAAAD